MTAYGRLLLAVAVVVVVSCSRSSSLTFDHGGSPDAADVTTIAYLKSLCRGSSRKIVEDISLSAVVTGNDLFGEFYKTLVVEDDSGGIEIAIDNYYLHRAYPVGATLKVYCQGLCLGDNGGKIQLGTSPTDIYTVDRLTSSEAAMHIRCTTATSSPRRAKVVGLDAVTMKDIGRYVRFDGVHFVECASASTWCRIDPQTLASTDTEYDISDADEHRFTVRTIKNCNYAKEPLPIGVGSLNGIVDYFNGTFYLRVVNHEIFF